MEIQEASNVWGGVSFEICNEWFYTCVRIVPYSASFDGSLLNQSDRSFVSIPMYIGYGMFL